MVANKYTPDIINARLVETPKPAKLAYIIAQIILPKEATTGADNLSNNLIGASLFHKKLTTKKPKPAIKLICNPEIANRWAVPVF